MLYVFIVTSGTMVKFDMNLAVKKVLELKTEIYKSVKIPVDDQVLLCSGGEELKPDSIVGNYYGAGTDTNPIFLFSKYTKEPENLYNIHLKTSVDVSIEDDVRGCANMAPSTAAATVRCALAQRFAETAVSGRCECDELVHGQHLQQQGWAAVIANLEDAKESLLKRKAHFEELFQKYLSNRSLYQESIKTFPGDIELLAKVPLLPKLMLGNEFAEADLKAEHTLLSWFCSEPRNVLESLAEKCQRALEELNEHSLILLNEDIANILLTADNPDIKEVKGIEERLSSLNKQIEDAKKLEKDQRDLAKWFSHTQGRISRDPQVLPDLCGTFQNQLELMLQNHKCLREKLERCTNAKAELSESINHRIKFICHVESEMYDLQVRIIFLEKHVRSVMKQIESFRQVHLAPQRYIKTLVEVCRRRVFSTSYMKWATELSAQAFKLYQKEISWREAFSSEESRNMVDNLFPGMEDVPPPFAIECPETFDQKLLNILKEDIEMLRNCVPELASFCEVPPPESMPYISQAESDSAFSSNVPSSRVVGDSADSGEKSQLDKGQVSPHKLAAPSGDYSSLPSEYASMPNEVFSLASSPFEDPLLPNADLEAPAKRTKAPSQNPGFSTSITGKNTFPVEEHTILEDGEEFETVDCYGTSPIEICSHSAHNKRQMSVPRPTSSSDVINVNKSTEDHCSKVSKAHSEGDAVSPMQERLKSSDSLLVSTDFQATEYYIDDSMPSSYTESNATSPLMRGNKMVKSHHVLVAELQRQVEEKNGALSGTMKFIQELQGGLQADLSSLKAFVKEEFGERTSEISEVVKNISNSMVDLQQQMILEKERALEEAESKFAAQENLYVHKLEVESQKLNDAENQIVNYEEYLQQMSSSLEELKHENEQMERELNLKKEIIKSMTLEYELELDSLRNQMCQEIQERDDNIQRITQYLDEKEAKIEGLQLEKNNLEVDINRKMQEKLISTSVLEQKEADFEEKITDLKLEIKQFQEGKDAARLLVEAEYKGKLRTLTAELEEAKQSLIELKANMEKSKQQELILLEEKLTAKHRNEIESLRSRFKLAVSTTSMDRLPSPISCDTLESEALISIEHLNKIITEKEKLEMEKEKLEISLEEEQRKFNDSVAEAVKEECFKNKSEYDKVAADLRREFEQNLEKMKSRFTAENQVSFNEAINNLAKEKEAIIDELRSRIFVLETKLSAIKLHLDKCSSVSECFAETGESVLSQSDSCASGGYKVLHNIEESKILAKLKRELKPYLQFTDIQPLQDSSHVSELNSELSKKMKLTGSSKSSPPCINCTFKISILSCDVGDLVLICYEEKNENFAVFHFGQYLHFLHPESFQIVNLKFPPGPSEKWALGIVIDKEFCVTRKANNRYKVSLGTKFYRVKVKPWDREKALAAHQWHRNCQLRSAVYSRTLSVQSPPAEDGDETKDTSHMSASAI